MKLGVWLHLSKYDELIRLTEQLVELNKEALDQYINITKTKGCTPDFYHEVKPFADKVLAIAEKWKPLALQWVRDEEIKYLYPFQIEDVFENITIVSIQAFYKDTRKRRFIELIKAIDYVLETILNQEK